MNSTDYREILKAELENKLSKSPRLSLRALAKKSGVSHSLISLVLKGTKSLSRESAFRICQVLETSEARQNLILSLVELETAKSGSYRQLLSQNIQRLSGKKPLHVVSEDAYKVISDWYYNAILELTRLQHIPFNPRSVAKALGLQPLQSTMAIDRLKRLNLLIEKGGRYKKVAETITSTNNVPDTSIREHHRQMITKAIESIETQGVKERYLTDASVAIDSALIPEAQAKLENMKEEFCEWLARSSKQYDSVYQINLQFFQLTKSQTKNEDSKKQKGEVQ